MGPRPYRGSIFKPANKPNLYMKLYDPVQRKVVKRTTPFFPGEEAQAREWLERAKAAFGGGHTVSGWAQEWLGRRRQAGIADADGNDEQRLRDHVLPEIGSKHLDEVAPKDVNALIQKLRESGYAPRTVRNVYSVLKAMYRDARIEGRCETDPCVLTKRQLGKVQDAELGWRAGAVFTRHELELLLTAPVIPLDRRVQYALLGVAALRDGEMAGLRWKSLVSALPLSRICVSVSYDGTPKTGDERWMPVHPVLATLLAEWHVAWPAHFGREHTPDDLVLPIPAPTNRGPRKEQGGMRDRNWVYKRWVTDLQKLGLRHRRVHDLRRTFISLAKAAGANESIIRWGTHAPPRHVMGLYTSVEWSTLCLEVSKLRVSLEPHNGDPEPEAMGGDVIPMFR